MDREKEQKNLHNVCIEVGFILQEEAHKVSSEIEVQLVGSVAKGTWLKGASDIDFFLKFPRGINESLMEANAGLITLSAFARLEIEPIVMNASHPYLKSKYKGYNIDVVPCYKMEVGDEIISAVDRTPLHTEYIQNNLKEEQKIEVIRLKKWMKDIGIYGAESSVKGFSGYLCELLIIYYGNFEFMFKCMSFWQEHSVFYMKYKGDYQFPDANLVFIDPVDITRNVAAAVSTDSYAKAITYASKNLPRYNLLYNEPAIQDFFDKRGTDVIVVNMRNSEKVMNDEIQYEYALKYQKQAIKQLTAEGFIVWGSEFIFKGLYVIYLFELESNMIPRLKKHYGPPAWNTKGRSGFLEKHNEFSIEDGKLITFIPRRWSKATNFLSQAIGDAQGAQTLDASVIKLTPNELFNKYINRVRRHAT